MKIECPSCHLAGKINELELPPVGRELTCPRCKNGFHVAKPPAAAGNQPMMNSCPSCQYATFTDEMFAVCPRCGLTAEDGRMLTAKKREREQLSRDQETLQRSFRNPDLIMAPVAESAVTPTKAAPTVEVTAWLCIAVGVALFCYGGAGLWHYYSKDWQAVLSEPLLEPVSRLFVFFSLGMMPWIIALFSLYFLWSAYRLVQLSKDSLARLTESAWAGIAVVVIHQVMAFFNWARVSSSTTSLSYYAVGVLSSLFMIALLGAPFFVLIRFLKTDLILREFKKAQRPQ